MGKEDRKKMIWFVVLVINLGLIESELVLPRIRKAQLRMYLYREYECQTKKLIAE